MVSRLEPLNEHDALMLALSLDCNPHQKSCVIKRLECIERIMSEDYTDWPLIISKYTLTTHQAQDVVHEKWVGNSESCTQN